MEKPDRLIYAGSAPSYHTCKHCQRLVIVFNDGHRDEFGIQLYNVVFEAAYKDIIEAANEDCSLCQYLIAKSPPYRTEFYRDVVLAATVKDGLSEITFMWWSPETRNMERQIGSCLNVSLSACKLDFTRIYRFLFILYSITTLFI
jgi:hypothetical protein